MQTQEASLSVSLNQYCCYAPIDAGSGTKTAGSVREIRLWLVIEGMRASKQAAASLCALRAP